jgi:hypothetical protein
MKKCDLCIKGSHHPSEHYERMDIHQMKKGDVVFIRAIVEDVEIHSWHTKVSIKHYIDFGGCKWKAVVNSVDVFPASINREGK